MIPRLVKSAHWQRRLPSWVTMQYSASSALRLLTNHAPEGLRDSPGAADRESRALLERWHGRDRLHYAITPRFAPTSSDAQLGVAGRLARDFPRQHEPCPIGSDRALDTALITAPEARDPELLQKLDAVAGRILHG